MLELRRRAANGRERRMVVGGKRESGKAREKHKKGCYCTYTVKGMYTTVH